MSPYKKSKFLSERAALALAHQGLPIVVVNPSAPVGPYDYKPTPTGKIILDFLNGRIPSYIDTGLNVVSVKDVAEGHYLAALRGRTGERYILGGENITLKEMLDSLAALSGLPKPRFKTPYALAYLVGAFDTARAKMTGAEPFVALDAVRMAKHYMWYDSSKAVQELGYRSSPVREAFREAINWFKKNGRVSNSRPAVAA